MAKPKHQLGVINITNQSTKKVVVDIEGIIGLPEWWQFDDPSGRVSTYNKFRTKVDAIKNIKAEEVDVNIRSLGGSVQDAILIHDALCLLDAKVTTICYGYTASAATLIAQAGETRALSSNSLYLVHQSATLVVGNIHDLDDARDTLVQTNKLIIGLYAKRSGQPENTFEELINRSNGTGQWLTPDQAQAIGLADEVRPMSGTVNLDSSMMNILGYPEPPEDLLLPTQNNNDLRMKIKNTLSAIWASLNLPDNQTEADVTDEQLLELNNELTTRQTTIDNQAAEIQALTDAATANQTTIDNQAAEITTLNEKITALNEKPGDRSNPVNNPTDDDTVPDNNSLEAVAARARKLLNT